VDDFLRRYLASYAGGDLPKVIEEEALEILCQYTWPGNVRELENVVERAVILQAGDRISVSDIPEKVCGSSATTDAFRLSDSGITLEELEKRYMIQVLEETSWHKKRAAEILGINPSTLYRKIKSYGLKDDEGADESQEAEEEVLS
jgi:DNA-binding NtrC family response regulator